jgi:outer membrane protein OmpA-like peptidoglycan-associated protein
MKKLSTLFALLCAAAPAAAGPDFVTPTPQPGKLTASFGRAAIAPSEDLVFALDSAILGDTEHTQVITVASWLRANPRYSIVLEGYADRSGAMIYNEDLATRRASAVRGQLIARGISPDRIVVVVYGETRATGHVNALDRRVVMHATDQPIPTVVAAALDSGAINAVWTRNKALFRETRGKLAAAVVTRE